MGVTAKTVFAYVHRDQLSTFPNFVAGFVDQGGAEFGVVQDLAGDGGEVAVGIFVGMFEPQDAEDGAFVVAEVQGVGLFVGRAVIEVAVMEHEIPAATGGVVEFFGMGGPGGHGANDKIAELDMFSTVILFLSLAV